MTSISNARLGERLVQVQVTDGRIASIAPSGSEKLRGEVVDLDGRWLFPGLWDNHVHFDQQALALRRVDLAQAKSAAEAAEMMAKHLAASKIAEGEILQGHGFRDGLWPDQPTAALLDRLVPDVPAVLVSADLHSCWLNSLALARFGFEGAGLLREDDCFRVVSSLKNVTEETRDSWVADAALAAAARGVVGVIDFEMTDNIASWSRRFGEGFSTLRIQAGIYRQDLDAAIAAGYKTGTPLDEAGLLEVGPFKILTDGSLNTRTAFCVEPYQGTDDLGILTVGPSELRPLMAQAGASGIIPAVHAIGDEANRLALDSFEAVGCGGRIEHAQLVRTEDFHRFAALGVAASVQPEHAVDDRDVTDRYWADRADRAFAWRSLVDAGAQLLFGSDAPVARLDPWRAMAAALFRTDDDRPAWHPEQKLSFDEALAASVRSSIEVGERADLVAVDADPESASAEQLRAMPVALTMVGGSVSYSSLSRG